MGINLSSVQALETLFVFAHTEEENLLTALSSPPNPKHATAKTWLWEDPESFKVQCGFIVNSALK